MSAAANVDGPSLSVVCSACARVGRMPMPLAMAGTAFTCPSCGAVKAPLHDAALPAASVQALSTAEAPRPVFSEHWSRRAPAAPR